MSKKPEPGAGSEKNRLRLQGKFPAPAAPGSGSNALIIITYNLAQSKSNHQTYNQSDLTTLKPPSIQKRNHTLTPLRFRYLVTPQYSKGCFV